MPSRRAALRATLAGLVAPEAASMGVASFPHTSSDAVIDIGERYRRHNVTGTFVLLSAHDDTLLLHNPARAEREFVPASTFKIPNSLIALETGAVTDENVVLAWDAKRHSVGPTSTWKDQSLRTALAASAVWFYQEMARRVGEATMKGWLDRLGYGNRRTAGGVDQFWLNGELRITPRQQMEFMRRLCAGDLPFSERTQRIVRDILVLQRSADYVLRGKTGLARREGLSGVGWFVGWVERSNRNWIFVSNIEVKKDTNLVLRKSVATEILAALGLIRA
jgi:beta-lactamase class D